MFILTRTTHAHDASRCASAYVHIAHAGRPWSSRTTVKSNMKSEHSLYLACEDSPQCAFCFALSLVLVLPC